VFRVFYLGILFLLMGGSVASALQIRGYDPDRNDRFESGFSGSPVPNTDAAFVGATFDLSGVGWDSSDTRRSVTLVTPQHFIGANHFPAGSGTVWFVNQAGVLKSYSVSSMMPVLNDLDEATDLYVGELAAPIAGEDLVAFYHVMNLATEAEYAGKELIVYGTEPVSINGPKLGVGVIDGFETYAYGGPPVVNATQAFNFDYDTGSGGVNDARGETGDSGSPSFVVVDGVLQVVGTHTAIRDFEPTLPLVETIDTFVPHYFDEINLMIASSGFQLNAVLIPEPGAGVLFLSGGLVLLVRRRRG
jgi:hypothetical protein